MRQKQMSKKDNVSSWSFSETKLYAVLSQFNKYDLNRLEKFVNSPYFNKNEEIQSLFESINDWLRSKTRTHLDKTGLWSSSTKGKPYNDLKFRKLFSDLLSLIENFLAHEVFDKNSLQQADNLLTAVYNRKLEALYNSSLSTADRMSVQYHFRPATYYYYGYSFERNYYNLSGLEIHRAREANIEQMAENLDKFYVAEKLRCYCIMLDRQRMAAHDYRVLFIDEIITHVESSNLVDVVPINLYYQIYLTQKEPNDPTLFEKLKTLVENYIKLLPQLEAFEILDSALNYCVNKVNRGNREYLREYMDLSLMGIRNEILLVNGSLSPWTFRNIVFAGLRLGDFDWVENFIMTYQQQIEDQYRDNAVSFNLANLYFYRKDYTNVIKLLQRVEYEDPAYNRNSKTILMATYYELAEFDSLGALLSSFELYLRRNKSIPENRKPPYLHLIKYVRSLTRISNTDNRKLNVLRQKVVATPEVVNKEWLIEKIDALLG